MVVTADGGYTGCPQMMRQYSAESIVLEKLMLQSRYNSFSKTQELVTGRQIIVYSVTRL